MGEKGSKGEQDPEIHTLVLSPHLDDAALSCGGWIHHLTSQGHRVLVATLFTQDLPTDLKSSALDSSDLGSSALDRVMEMMNLQVETAMALRRKEDETACTRLGAEWTYGDFPEALARTASDGKPCYTGLEQLFGPFRSEDSSILGKLRGYLRELPSAREVLVPLTVGNHVDHQWVRRAAEEVWGGELRYYEDFPYVTNGPLALHKVLGFFKRGWKAEKRLLSEADWVAKVESIQAYKTQLDPLFGGAEKVDAAVRKWGRKVGGERYWRRFS